MAGLGFVWEEMISGLQPPRVITIIGGGGKTSLMYYLQSGLNLVGLMAVAATTTKLCREASCCYVPIASLAEGCEAVETVLGQDRLITLVAGVAAGESAKMAGISPDWIDRLAGRFPDTVFLVEGDGSAGKPLKGHLAHEPVIPASSGLVIAVVGIDALGVPLTEVGVHRPERVTELTGVEPGMPVTVQSVVRLLLHPDGYLRQCPPASRVVPFINKVESPEQHRQAQKLAAAILAGRHPQVEAVVIGSVRRQAFRRVVAE